MNYYDPMFYICSEHMPFTIRIEVTLRDLEINGELLSETVNRVIRRYPYFAVSVEEQNGELIAVPNDRPVVVYPGPWVHPLGGPAVNRHLVALAYEKNVIYFYASHVITDGSGFFPFVKTVLYYYLSGATGTELDPAGIRLITEPFYPDELGNPFPEEAMAAAVPLCPEREVDCFRVRDTGLVNNEVPTVFRFRMSEAEVMAFNHDNDGSPCALVSSLMAKAIWSQHPENTKPIVSAVSFNLRPGLGNKASYRMLCSALKLAYPEKMRNWEIAKLCTCSRGMVTLQSQPENVLAHAQKRRQRMEQFLKIPTVAEKKRVMGAFALEDAVNNTFSVSYVGKMNLGSLEQHIESIYNLTDGSTYQTPFIEISAVNGCFDIAFLQSFSLGFYYVAFLEELDRCGLHYEEQGSSPMNTPKMILP